MNSTLITKDNTDYSPSAWSPSISNVWPHIGKEIIIFAADVDEVIEFALYINTGNAFTLIDVFTNYLEASSESKEIIDNHTSAKERILALQVI